MAIVEVEAVRRGVRAEGDAATSIERAVYARDSGSEGCFDFCGGITWP